MEHKPCPLLILAFIHFIEPVTKVVFYSIYFHLSPLIVITNVIQFGTAIHAFEFFFLFPIAGLAIYSIKKWSFPVFILVELWVFIINVPYLTELYQTNQLWLLTLFSLFGVLNLAIVSYLLLPAVRIAYLDPAIRWWEAKPRYSVNIDCQVNHQNMATIKNISASGVFILADSELPINSNLELKFRFSASAMDYNITANVIVLHKFSINGIEGYGSRFVGLSTSNQRLVKSMLKYLEKTNTMRRPPRRNMGDLILWMITFLKTGKGLTTYIN